MLSRGPEPQPPAEGTENIWNTSRPEIVIFSFTQFSLLAWMFNMETLEVAICKQVIPRTYLTFTAGFRTTSWSNLDSQSSCFCICFMFPSNIFSVDPNAKKVAVFFTFVELNLCQLRHKGFVSHTVQRHTHSGRDNYLRQLSTMPLNPSFPFSADERANAHHLCAGAQLLGISNNREFVFIYFYSLFPRDHKTASIHENAF